jgi:hypothetical protein
MYTSKTNNFLSEYQTQQLQAGPSKVAGSGGKSPSAETPTNDFMLYYGWKFAHQMHLRDSVLHSSISSFKFLLILR